MEASRQGDLCFPQDRGRGPKGAVAVVNCCMGIVAEMWRELKIKGFGEGESVASMQFP